MINFIKSPNILSDSTDILVVPTNTKGVAGAGLAKAVLDKYPDWYEHYKSECEKHKLSGGDLIWYETQYSPLFICSLCTKEDWRNSSRLKWVRSGLERLRISIDSLHSINLVSLPMLGCGKGGLIPEMVRPVMIETLKDSPKLVRVYE